MFKVEFFLNILFIGKFNHFFSCTLDALGSDAVEVSASGDRQLDLMEDTEEVDFDLEVFGASDFKTPFTTKNIDPMVEEIPYAYFKASAFIKNEFPEQETDHFLHIKRCNAELIDDEGKMLQTRRLLFKGCKDNDVFAERNVLRTYKSPGQAARNAKKPKRKRS